MRRLLLPLLLTLTLAVPARAEEKLLPVSQQVVLLLKALTYDRTLMQSEATVLQIGILYNPGDPASRATFDEFEAEFRKYSDKTLRGHAVALVPITQPGGPAGVPTTLPAGLHVLYSSAPEVSKVAPLTNLTRGRGILSATPIEACVEAGFSLGLVVRNGRTGVTINRTASAAEGMVWAEDFLHLCRLVD